jgi:hemolysin activation/secretion protein
MMLASAHTRILELFRGKLAGAKARGVSCTAAHVTTILITVLVTVLGAIAAVPAQAQSVPQAGFDPRQAERKFDVQSDQRAPGPPLRAPRASFAKPDADPTPLFVLRKVSISGAQAIAPDALAHAYHAYLGKKVSQAELAAMAEAISEAYRAKGFHLSRAIVPPQDVARNQIRVQVIEGSIAELVVKGEGAETFGVRAALQPVLAEHPARLDTLQRQLLLLNDRPGLRILDTQLEEIGTATGRFRLIVQVQTWRVYLSAGLDNAGSASVGPWQAYATTAFNSLGLAGDTLAINLSTVPNDPSELKFARIAYDAPIGIDGIRIGGAAFHSDVSPGDERRQFDTRTRTDSAELRGSFVPLKSQASSLTFTFAAAMTEASSDDVFGAIYRDHVRTLGLSADYRLQDSFKGTNFLTVGFRQGFNVLGASQEGDDFLSRDGASGQFSVINAWYTRLQTIDDAWSIKLAGAGQFASAPMLLSQQFYLGGAAFGRGYGGAEISGDNGVAGSMEIRFDQAVNFAYLNRYQLYGFLDTGAVWNHGAGLADGVSLASAGAGIRLTLHDQLQLGLAVAKPLTYAAPDNPNRGLRVLFSVTDAIKLCPGQNRMACS